MTDPYNDPWVKEFLDDLRKTKDANIDSVLSAKTPRIPIILYRYRAINNENCKSLDKRDYPIWLSHPYKFTNRSSDQITESDGSSLLYEKEVDSVIHFSDASLQRYAFIQEIRKYLEDYYGENYTRELIMQKRLNWGSITLDGMKSLASEVAKNKGISDTNEVFTQLSTNAESQIDYYNKSIRDRMYKRLAIGCFTTDKYSDYMWNNYADKGKGMCIEYDMTKIDDANPGKKEMCPVYYTDEITDMSYLLDEDRDKDNEYWNTQILPILLTKKIQYHREKEWRLVIANKVNEDGYLFPFIKPSKIYLGPLTPYNSRRRVERLAKKINVEVVQLKKGDVPNTYHENNR